MPPRPTPVLLEFDPALRAEHEQKPLRDNLSVAVRTGRNLWVASDETTAIERLTELKPGHFGAHARFALHELLDLAGKADEEVDVEGLAEGEGYVWIVGSHGLKRKKPKKSLDMADQLDRLATVSRDPNRYLLARIPCVREGDGESGDYQLRREAPAPAATGRTSGGDDVGSSMDGQPLVAARLAGNARGNELTEAIAKDEHLAPFLEIPGKDNGFDIEGMAFCGRRIFLGLRGPVLRGWAVILSLEVEEDKDDRTLLHLVEREVGTTAKGKKVTRGYAKHFVYLGGMGIRELRAVGDDLLVLAGPTMVLDGTIAVFRWKDGGRAQGDCLVPKGTIERLFDVPHGTGPEAEHDRAEGMTLWTAANGGPKELLVVYDSPSESRCRGDAGVIADLFPLVQDGSAPSPRRRRDKAAAPDADGDSSGVIDRVKGALHL